MPGTIYSTKITSLSRFARVEEVDDGHWQVCFEPESVPPINDSPVYHLKIAPHAQPLTLDLLFGRYSARYAPRCSLTQWAYLPKEQWKQSAHRLVITLPPSSSHYVLASHPPYLMQMSITQMRQIAQECSLDEILLGHTTLRRPLLLWQNKMSHADKNIVLIARQHPAEVSGQWACMTFAKKLWSRKKTKTTRIQCIPTANPDGIEGLHWRHNAMHGDLNRDWGVFAHLETCVIQKHIHTTTSLGPNTLVIDFHSTKKKGLYVPVLNTFVDARWSQFLKVMERRHGFEIKKLPEGKETKSCTQYYATKGCLACTCELEDGMLEQEAARWGEVLAERWLEVFDP